MQPNFCSRLLLTAALTLTLAASARATLYSYTNVINEVIPDGNPVGYSSTIATTGLTGNGGTSIGNVSVQLNFDNLTSDGFIGDLYGYLVFVSDDGSTTQSILLNRVGRTDASGFGYESTATSITLTGNLTGGYVDIHGVSTWTSGGTYLADGRTVDPDGNFTGATSTAGLDIMNGHNANGTWTLFLADFTEGNGTSTLTSWGLTIDVVPEPTTWALAAFGTLAGVVLIARRRTALRPPGLRK
jgi:hypothetical protein